MIAVKDLTIYAGAFALREITFEVPAGRYAVLMGKTGTGKTTLLEALCGLKPVSAGRIELNGRDVTQLKPAERNIGYVPQDAALFPTMTVRQHLAFSLMVRRWSRSAMDRRVGELAELLGISDLLERSPGGLSGGERQRVALGRALACHPPILCLDEPLGALDDDTRQGLYTLLESVQEATGVTTLHVTHHRDEAARLADLILVIENGGVREQAI
ncbi:MAG: ABC transporter ATP-binding protein [Planctomycetes bacterium]|nr:ABC transporter ATP-binding protein [Planctomycetota bacterium]